MTRIKVIITVVKTGRHFFLFTLKEKFLKAFTNTIILSRKFENGVIIKAEMKSKTP